MDQNNEAASRDGEKRDTAPSYPPLGLKAVIAAAMMLKRPAAAKAKKAA
ncbi:hypothetical protein NOF55_18310 [Rhizobiaceae bacterium BDR2-2]|uniref:Uncharacterized protein n=1 Tax=Ectorhizobium quercum TaxID=2965071 RepID=A0AAE3N1Z5_9HYPH|nr:hypothetical protein [Ectorhizobium quercum]MCX8999064.1 hypothetical protein [Ectorhizobium quercum]